MSEEFATPVPTLLVATRHTEAYTPDTTSGEDDEAAPVRLAPGATVPDTRFRIRRWLGEGGMGVVYEAEHVDLERHVALKILRPEVASVPEERERFRQEARMTTQIASPHVVGVLDFGFLRDGRAYYVMELLSGHSLADEIDAGPVPMPRVVGLMRQMCAGLHAAHRAGVIHRDCKPDNAMVICDRSGRDCVKLLDFGIASPRGDEGDRRVCGTPEYMAPEQIEGLAFDGRLDQYALACTVYALLTGEPPFRAPHFATLLQLHVDRPPLPPSARRPELAKFPAIEAVIMRCLAKDPEDRFSDMAEVEMALCEAQIADGLRTAWDDLPLPDVDVRRRRALEERMPKPRRSSRAARLAKMVATPLATVIVIAGWLASTTIGADERAQIEDLVAQARAAATRGLFVYPLPGEDAATAYRTVVELERVEGPAAALARERALALRRELAVELTALGDSYWDVPGARAFARDYYAQAVVFDPADVNARAWAGFTPGELTDLRVRAENQEFSAPELAAAEPLINLATPASGERAERVEQAARARERSRVLPASAGSRRAKSRRNDPDVLRESLAATVAAPVDATADRDAPEPRRSDARAKRVARLGKQALETGDRETAQRAFHDALDLDAQNAAALAGLSDVYFDEGEHGRALDYARRAAAAEPDNLDHLVRLGDAHYKLRDLEAARRSYSKAGRLGHAQAPARLRRLDRDGRR